MESAVPGTQIHMMASSKVGNSKVDVFPIILNQQPGVLKNPDISKIVIMHPRTTGDISKYRFRSQESNDVEESRVTLTVRPQSHSE
jgi:hypothetical protein